MRLPVTLSLYIGRRFLAAILLAVLALACVTLMLDIIELLRRASGRENVPIGAVLQMAFLKFPNMVERLMPFAVMAGGMFALSRLTRSQELVVARAAGVSVWQFLAPALAVVFSLGVLMTCVFNPLSAALLLKFEQVEGKYLTGKPSLLSVSDSGLWLRQMEGARPGVSEHIIHAARLSQVDMSFSPVIVFSFDAKGRFLDRLDAERAVLEPGILHLSRVTYSQPGHPPQLLPEFTLPTDLRIEHLQDSFSSPETISFWRLPGFIAMLENAGFSALRHRLHWHGLLSTPFLYAGMILIAALFSLKLPRFGKVGLFAAAGVGTGFALYSFTDIVQTFGIAGTLPVPMAAWTPAAIIAFLGMGTLLHLEDG